MKFHANPKLLVAIGTLCISGLFGLTAHAAANAQMLQKLNLEATLEKGASFSSADRQKNLLNLLGRPITNANKAAVCGDSEPDAGEECDDGNLANGDGCDSTCLVETPWDCTTAIAGSSNENILVDGSFEAGNGGGEWTTINNSLIGADFICGDGCFGFPNAAAPDGSLTSGNWLILSGFNVGDGPGTGQLTHAPVAIPASATTLEFQWGASCAATTDGMSLSIGGTQVWSNLDAGDCTDVDLWTRVVVDLSTAPGGPYQGTTNSFEFLATTSDDGVTPGRVFIDDVSVNIPAVPVIDPVPSSCFQAVCGDGVFSFDEECDDGNTAGGDGCSAGCTIEQPDFVCSDPTVDSFNILAGDVNDAILEGSLEDGRGRITFDWDEVDDGGNNFPPICSEVFCGPALANSGAFYAWFGGFALPTNSAISQTVDIPADATELTFELLIGICDSPADELTVTIDGTEVWSSGACADTPVYLPQSADISAFAGLTGQLIEMRGITFATNGGNTNFFVDDISIPLSSAQTSGPSVCTALDTACTPIEQFEAGIPANWTVINLGPDSADGWGTTGDGICAAFNWSGNPDDNVTTGAGIAACADSDATGQADIDAMLPENEMDTYLCTNSLDLSLVTDPRFSFNTNFQSADTDFNDNGTPGDTSDDFDDDLLEVLVGTAPPNSLTVTNDTIYTRLGGVNDHLSGSLALTGPQELSANLAGSAIEGNTGYVCLHYRSTYSWFAQIDNAGVRGTDCAMAPLDSDSDGVFDSVDNCTDRANPGQEDTNADGFGNACDMDVTNTCTVTFLDFAPITQPGVLFSSVGNPNYDPDLDFDSNGIINFLDVGRYPNAIFMPPGPSANTCVPGLGN